MKNLLTHRLESIHESKLNSSLTQIKRGLEKESLRVNNEGHLAQTPHPQALGSALTHQWITTDYSEALLEFITPVFQDVRRPLEFLNKLHSFTYHNIGDEILWVNSMPCIMSGELSIPIAEYGSSNVGRMKNVYRHGLWHRYGRYMQTIAGIHYNLSFPDSFWSTYHQLEDSQLSLQDFKSEQYMALIRNFLRNVGLVVYLYGASPAVCATFLQGRDNQLASWKQHTRYMPHGTSLRMSDLGYNNAAQSDLKISYNSLTEYVASLQHAIRTPSDAYERIGIKEGSVYKQLNTNILQIENEFYSSIRPKRVTESGERPTCALSKRGVEYIEMRCVDLNPFEPVGVSESQLQFLDVFALYCLLEHSPILSDKEVECNHHNLQVIVSQGRDPSLRLSSPCTQAPFRQWANDHLQNMLMVAQLFDQAHGNNQHSQVVKHQIEKLHNPDLTPSAKVIRTFQQQDQSFYQFALDCALSHRQHFMDQPLSQEEISPFLTEAKQSLSRQQQIESHDSLSFEQYLDKFFQQDALL